MQPDATHSVPCGRSTVHSPPARRNPRFVLRLLLSAILGGHVRGARGKRERLAATRGKQVFALQFRFVSVAASSPHGTRHLSRGQAEASRRVFRENEVVRASIGRVARKAGLMERKALRSTFFKLAKPPAAGCRISH
jgi:hypothetical protein